MPPSEKEGESMDIKAHHSYLVLLLKAVWDGEPLARRIFESADFKAATRHWAGQYEKEVQQQLCELEHADNEISDEKDPGDVLEFIVEGKEAAKNAMAEIRRWLKGSRHIVICDPYIMHPKKSPLFKSDEDYVRYVRNLIPKTARKVDFFGNGFTQRVKSRMLREVSCGPEIRFYDTKTIHDRYIIRDRKFGRMIGTSLGGFGNKLFTVLDLPPRDTTALLAYLDKIRRQPASQVSRLQAGAG
jgi:hypothetical protein